MSDELFGVDTRFDRRRLHEWFRALQALWHEFADRPLGDLEGDLELLGSVFGKGAEARRLRVIASRAQEPSVPLPETIALPVESGALITPSGRVLLEELRYLKRIDSDLIVTDRCRVAAEQVASAYARWYAEWAAVQLKAQLSPPVLAFAAFLLVSGAIGADNALPLPADESEQREIVSALIPIIDAGSLAMGGRRLGQVDTLRSNWVVTQATRHLGAYGLVRRARDGKGSGADLWIEPESQERYTIALKRQFARRHDSTRALSQLYEAYRENRPRLLVLGAAHDTPMSAQKALDSLQGP